MAASLYGEAAIFGNSMCCGAARAEIRGAHARMSLGVPESPPGRGEREEIRRIGAQFATDALSTSRLGGPVGGYRGAHPSFSRIACWMRRLIARS